MNKYELKAAQPSMTDYGSFEADGVRATVEMQKDVAAKVRVSTGGMAGKGLVAALTQRYGKPIQQKCYVTACEGKWRVNEQIDAYVSLGGEITYQLSTDQPPIGLR